MRPALRAAAIVLAAAATVALAAPANAVVPGKNGKIVFSVNSGNGIGVVNPDGSDYKIINGSGRTPKWSPNGAKILYVDGAQDAGDLYLMNADGTGRTQLTFTPQAVRDPAWSPDGATIAFVSNRATPQFDVYSMKIDGSSVRRITIATSAHNLFPSYSPDGAYLIHVGYATSPPAIIARDVDGDSGGTVYVNHSIGQPAWSPDGRTIAVQNFYTIEGVDWATWKVSTLVAGSPAKKVFDPAWSPDGKRLLYSRGDGDLYTADANGANPLKVLATPNVGEREPDWQSLS